MDTDTKTQVVNPKAPVTITAIDRELWRRTRVEAVRRGITIGAVVEQALEHWLDLYWEDERK